MKQRLLLTIFSLFVLSVTIFAEYYTDNQGIVYSYNPDGNTAYVDDGESTTGTVVIPETIRVDGKTYTVTEINYWAFRDCTDLREYDLRYREAKKDPKPDTE